MDHGCQNCGCPPIVKIEQSVVNGFGQAIQLIPDVIWQDGFDCGTRKLQWSIIVNDNTIWESGYFIPQTSFPVGSASTFEQINVPGGNQDWIDFANTTLGITISSTDKLEIKLEVTNCNNKNADSEKLLLQAASETTLVPLTCNGTPITCNGEMIYC